MIKLEPAEEELGKEAPLPPGRSILYIEYYDSTNSVFEMDSEQANDIIEKLHVNGHKDHLIFIEDEGEEYKGVLRFDDRIKTIRLFSGDGKS